MPMPPTWTVFRIKEDLEALIFAMLTIYMDSSDYVDNGGGNDDHDDGNNDDDDGGGDTIVM